MSSHDRITSALLLAAGTGSRLQPLTRNAPKCLTEVGGLAILERLVDNLRDQGIERLVVVIGYLGAHIRDFLDDRAGGMRVDYIFSPEYRTTNNIYSLWLAREQIREPFLLVESDLVFDTSMLEDMLHPDKIAISRIRPWMNGTTVTVGPERKVSAFHVGGHAKGAGPRYKTINVYSLSMPTWNKVVTRLNFYISDGRVNEYYEAVFAEMVADGTLSFEAVFFDADRWYEIDTIVDLGEAERMFTGTPLSYVGPDIQCLQVTGKGSSTSVAAND